MEPLPWALENFSEAPLGDVRRTRRLVGVAASLMHHPGASMPNAMENPAQLQALYRLANNDNVTHQGVTHTHFQRTRQRARQCTTSAVLFIHDMTELDYSGRQVAAELGQIGAGKQRGFKCFNTLAVDAHSGQVLGLAHQHLHRRDLVGKGETAKQRRLRATRESRLWPQASRALGAAPEGLLWVEVADREADTFEYFDQAHNPFLVRSRSNRRIRYVDDNAEKHTGKLHDYLRSLPGVDQRVIKVAARAEKPSRSNKPAQPAQPARTATVHLAFAPVRLVRPQGQGKAASAELAVWGVRVWEEEAPEGVEALEWLLISAVPVEDVVMAWQSVDWYRRRPLVEDLHKSQKTGCHIEGPQFTTRAGLEPVVGVLSVVAVFLLQLRQLGRAPEHQEDPADRWVPATWIEVLSGWRWPKEPPRLKMTIKEFLYALARLGGHQNRKGDGDPGWITLWRGWGKLLNRVEGFRLGQQARAHAPLDFPDLPP